MVFGSFKVCKPVINDGTTCDDKINFHRYVENFHCAGDSDTSERLLKEVHLSFPSGHSSFATYVMVYIVVSIKWILFISNRCILQLFSLLVGCCNKLIECCNQHAHTYFSLLKVPIVFSSNFKIYLQCRMMWRGSRLLKHFIQYMMLMMAWFTCMSRISDYKHHWSDVLAGGAVGATVAMIIVSIYFQ